MTSPFASPFAASNIIDSLPNFDSNAESNNTSIFNIIDNIIKRKRQEKIRSKIEKYVNAHINVLSVNRLKSTKSLASYEKSIFIKKSKHHIHDNTAGTLMVSKKKPYRVRFDDKPKIRLFKKTSKPLVEIYNPASRLLKEDDSDEFELLYI